MIGRRILYRIRSSALRVSEILALMWMDLDFADQVIEVKRAYVWASSKCPSQRPRRHPYPCIRCSRVAVETPTAGKNCGSGATPTLAEIQVSTASCTSGRRFKIRKSSRPPLARISPSKQRIEKCATLYLRPSGLFQEQPRPESPLQSSGKDQRLALWAPSVRLPTQDHRTSRLCVV